MKKEEVAGLIATLMLLVCGLWAHFAAPCGLWKFAKTGEVPARCMMESGK